MKQLSALISEHGVDVLEHLDRDQLVPVFAGLQAQGDVAVVPAAMVGRVLPAAVTPVPKAGVAVVRGENGGNTHLLLPDGGPGVFYDPAADRDGTSLVLGTLTVEEGVTAYLAHPEHAFAGIAPGTYEIRRQREQADEIRLVQD